MVIVEEGKTRLFLPELLASRLGPAKRKIIFYNPAMEFNRDLSILLLQVLIAKEKRRLRILDGLAGSGARGVRIAKEVEGEFEVFVNDRNEEAWGVIKKNIALNRVSNAFPLNKNLNQLLNEEKFDYIDIDPFGSPVGFVDNAFWGARREAVMGITATDLAVLCGRYPKACLRRYGAQPLRCSSMHELGLRILIGFIARSAMKYDLGIKLLLSYFEGHHFRTYFRIEKGVKKANNNLENLGWIEKLEEGYEVHKEPTGINSKRHAGPLWTGKIRDQELVEMMLEALPSKSLKTKNKIERMLKLFLEENEVSTPFFYRTDELASLFHCSAPPLGRTIISIRERGYRASRTHFNPTGIKTDAPLKSIRKLFIS
ncbi:MAG TPA: tRNA (guanine(10)-N(2))-dimethyltransferase [Thermoplasmata archaeon]|nr:tRNA (guanine(10)-N(2))-dimethyltransferase [Thermoplasmata archaeon]